MNIQDIEYTYNSEHNTIWMTVKQIAKLYKKSVVSIRDYHILNIFKSGVLEGKECKMRYSVLKKLIKSPEDLKIFKFKYGKLGGLYFYNHEVVVLVGLGIDLKKVEAFEKFLEKKLI